MSDRLFLQARWEYLVMFNYEVDPMILKPHLPPGTEIDYFDGKALVSVVGFLFNDIRVWGTRWPWHVNFEEVNLRYYVKRFDGVHWKRGVGFVSEIVPRVLVAAIANMFYNEHYSTAKMNHRVEKSGDNLYIEYSWKKRKQVPNSLSVKATPALQDILPGSEAEFIFEHYYGYNKLDQSTSIEYEVSHPRWQIFPVTSYSITCDIGNLYGQEFVPFIINQQPHSVLLARGSSVTVRRPVKIKA